MAAYSSFPPFTPKTISGFCSLPTLEQETLRQEMDAHLRRYSKTSATFMLNYLPGTPTFLLIDQNLQLLERWFGHTPEIDVIKRIEKYVGALSTVKQELWT